MKYRTRKFYTGAQKAGDAPLRLTPAPDTRHWSRESAPTRCGASSPFDLAGGSERGGCQTRSTSRRIDHSTANTSLRVASSMPFFCSASIASSMTVMNSCSLMFMPLCVATMSLPE